MSDEDTGIIFIGLDIDGLIGELEESTSKTRRESKKMLFQGGKDIMRASQMMSPVDEHRLENAHKLDTVRLNEDFMELQISVGGEVEGRNVDEYAEIMHENLLPFGSGSNPGNKKDGTPKKELGLGPLSRAKNASNPPDRPVGGKFLERAVTIYEAEIIEKLRLTLPGAE